MNGVGTSKKTYYNIVNGDVKYLTEKNLNRITHFLKSNNYHQFADMLNPDKVNDGSMIQTGDYLVRVNINNEWERLNSIKWTVEIFKNGKWINKADAVA